MRGGLTARPGPLAPLGARPAAGVDLDQPPTWAARGAGAMAQAWQSAIAGVEWTPLYVAFLAYMFTIITYRLPLAQPAIVFGLGALLIQREPFRIPPLFWLLVVFLAWCAVGYTQTLYPGVVLQWLNNMGKLALIILVGANALRSRAQIRFYLIFCLVCFAFYPLRGAIFNYFFGGYTTFGRAIWNYTYENPNDLAAHTLLWVSGCAGLLFTERKGLIRLGAFLGVGALTLLLFMTQSRGGILGAAPLVLGAFALTKGRRLKTFFTFGLVAGVLAMFAPKEVWSRMTDLAKAQNTENLASYDSSVDQRWEIWKVARAIIREHPVFGVGIGAYPRNHGVYSARSEFKATARGERDTHSTYLNVTAETGFLGVGIFSLIFVVTLIHAERIRRRCVTVMPKTALQLRFLELGLLAFLTAGLFGSFGKINVTYLHTLLIWAFAEAVRRDLDRVVPSVRR